MTGVILRGLAVRKARALLTAIAVVLGVAMISGTFVLMDTVMSAFSTIFQTAYLHTDAVVTAQTPFGAIGAAKPPIPGSLLATIRSLPQVSRAYGYIDAHAQLTSAAGTPVGKASQEASVFGIPAGQVDAMNPLHLVAGTWPRGDGQILIDQSTASANHLAIGSAVGLVARKPLERFQVVGIFRFANATAMPTQFTAVDLPVAQQIFDKPGAFDEIDVSASPGVSAARLVSAIRQVLPATAQVTTASAQAATGTADVGDQFNLVRYVLFTLGAIALLVGSFVIFNTFSITVAQRTRELATLRALGASRRQVLGSIVAEGGLIGAAASVAGLGLGVGFAKLLAALFASSGVHLPAAGTVLSWRTVAVSIGAGLLVTVAACLLPGLRAMRTAPVLAMRDRGEPPPGPGSRARAWAAVLLLALGVAAVAAVLVVGGLPVIIRLLLLAAAAVVLIAGIAAASGWAIPGLASAAEKPVDRFTKGSGELAREDVIRNRARTARTAAALTVGVALVAFVAVLAQGLRDSTGNSIRHQVSADYVITSQFDVLPPGLQQALSANGIASAGVRAGTVHVLGANQPMTGVDPAAIGRFYHFTWASGSGPGDLQTLTGNEVILASDFASSHHLERGSAIAVQTTSGRTLQLTVHGIYNAPALTPLLGAMTITTPLFDRGFSTPGDGQVYADLGPGQDRATLTTAVRGFTTAQVRTLGGFIAAQESSIGIIVNLLYVLLALCVLISLLGIVNTLALSVTERTREIGMLRAIGMTRTQLRRMIGIESELIALIGAVIGIVAGLVLAGLTALALSAWSVGFSVPWAVLAILIVAAVLAGAVAGLGPARRAARLDPLTAISYE